MIADDGCCAVGDELPVGCLHVLCAFVICSADRFQLDGFASRWIVLVVGEEISQKDLREFKEKFTPGMVLETLNIKNIKIQDEKGNPIDMKKFMNKKNVFNPIELQ
jgi:hypothetical protein